MRRSILVYVWVALAIAALGCSNEESPGQPSGSGGSAGAAAGQAGAAGDGAAAASGVSGGGMGGGVAGGVGGNAGAAGGLGGQGGEAGGPATDPCLEGGMPQDVLEGMAETVHPGPIEFFAVADDGVYFTIEGEGLLRVLDGGTAAETVVASFAIYRFDVVADSVVWLDRQGGPDSDVYKAARSANALPELVATIEAPTLRSHAVTDDAYFYAHRNPNELVRVSLADGSKQTLLEGPEVEHLQARDGYVYFVQEDIGNRSVMRVPEAGGTPERLTPVIFSPIGYTLGDGEIFWNANGDPIIYRTPIGSPDAQTEVGSLVPSNFSTSINTTQLWHEGDRLSWMTTSAIGHHTLSGSGCGVLMVKPTTASSLRVEIADVDGSTLYFKSADFFAPELRRIAF